MDVDGRVNSTARPAELFLERGTYAVVPVGTADGGLFDAWSSWSQTTCRKAEGCRLTSPTTLKGFLGNYVVISPDLGRAFVDGRELRPARGGGGSGTAFVRPRNGDDAFVRVVDPKVYPTASLARAHASTAIVTLRARTTVGLAITDSGDDLDDNRGGLSFRVTRIAGIGPATNGRAVSVPVDIEPGQCRNRIDTGGRGKKHVRVAILGTDEVEGTDIDPASVRLAGVSPERWKVRHVTPAGAWSETGADRGAAGGCRATTGRTSSSGSTARSSPARSPGSTTTRAP